MGIAASAPTAKLHVNCSAVAGQSNPSNVRFQNLQGGAGKYLVIDSNGYVYQSSTGPTGSAFAPAAQTATSSPLNLDLQNQMNNLKNGPWLGESQPNSSNGSTQIEYSLPAGTSTATCQVYSLDGRLLSSIVLNPSSGKNRITVDTGKFASGMYIYSLVINGKATDTKKMVVSH